MKSSKSIKVTVLTLFTCILGAGFCESIKGQAAGEDYYVVDGQKVVLPVSQKYRALKLKAGMSAATIKSFKANIDSGNVGTVADSPVLEKYGIVLVQIKEGVGSSSFVREIENMSTREEVESRNPVYGVGGIDQVLTNEFAVQFKSEASEESINLSIRTKNAEVVKKHEKIKNRYILRFIGKSAREALAISNQYHQDPLVEFSEPNFILIYPQRPEIEKKDIGPEGALTPSPETTPDDPLYPKQWYLNNTGSVGNSDADIDAPEAWNIQIGSSAIIIAIIDEGVEINHPDLKDKIVTPYDATDGDNNQEPNSWDGHGTACAGIAAAITKNSLGVAGIGWKVKILPVRIAYSNVPHGPWITSISIIQDGIRTAVDRGANVLSNSWGGGSPSSAINLAIDHAINNNCVVVFAAGNNAGPVSYPANLSLSKTIIAVSATNEWDEFKTPSSSDGEGWWGSNFGPQINIAAPGVHMYTTDISGPDGYTSGNYVSNFNGTSSATPLVAGTAALVLSQNPGWNPDQVRNRLQKKADDLGATGFDDQFGHGRLNAWKSLKTTGNCGTIGSINQSVKQNVDQYVVNAALLFSTVLLFFFVLIIRNVKNLLLHN